jgi:heat shock protein HtpX
MTSAYSQQHQNVQRTWILMFLFVGLVSALFYIVSAVTRNPFWAFIGLFVSLAQAIGGYFFGDKLALSSAGAKEINYDQNPQLFEMVQNLAKVAGIPTPKVFISPDPSPNAFACGRDPKHANVCFNQGILDVLDKNELEGVTAHELSHIKNRDILVMTVTMVMASIIGFVCDAGMRMVMWGGMSGGDEDNSGPNPVVMIFFVISMLAMPFLAMLIQMGVSRQREFLADASGAVLTRYPQGLASALQKLNDNPVPTQNYSTAMAHFYISEPKREWGKTVKNMFSTHPALEDRIEALNKMG